MTQSEEKSLWSFFFASVAVSKALLKSKWFHSSLTLSFDCMTYAENIIIVMHECFSKCLEHKDDRFMSRAASIIQQSIFSSAISLLQSSFALGWRLLNYTWCFPPSVGFVSITCPIIYLDLESLPHPIFTINGEPQSAFRTRFLRRNLFTNSFARRVEGDRSASGEIGNFHRHSNRNNIV